MTTQMEQMESLGPKLDRPLVVYDVGARWGVFSSWEALGDRVRVVGFDPDSIECERLNQLAPPNVTYVPVALGDRCGSAVLHVTQEPACSSLYPPRESLINRSSELQIVREIDTVDIDLLPLDEWILRSGERSPDVLKLDTQGSELDILRGATNTLSSIELVEIEVEFNAIYEGQPLFWQVDAHLRDAGFELWRLGPLVHYSADSSGSRGSLPLQVYFDSVPVANARGAGQLFWAQAYYAKTDLCVCGADRMPASRGLLVAAAAFGLGLCDLAELALSRIQSYD